MADRFFDFILIDDYIDDRLRAQLTGLALSKWSDRTVKYQPCGKRGYFNLNDTHQKFSFYADQCIQNIMEEAGVSPSEYRPARHFVGINIRTSFVTPHTDVIQFADTSSLLDPVEIRFNTFLQRPDGGGVPVIGDTPVPIPKGYALAFDAAVVHSSTPVEGDTIRVVCSVSAAISRHACGQLLKLSKAAP